MNWRAFDLNLLVVFDGLFREGSVTRAGRRLGMSQPALSHALNRLRYLLKDQLFIRTPKGMVPTPRAEQLALPLRHALAQMEQALEPETFVAAQANRRFSIAINNYAAIVVAAPLVAAVSAAAPVAQLDLRPSGTLDVFDRLDSGELELGIGTFGAVGERFGSAALLEDRFVAVMRRGHPAGRGKLSAEVFGALAHIEGATSDRGAAALSLRGRRPRRVEHGGHAEPASRGSDGPRVGVDAPAQRAAFHVTDGSHLDAVAPPARWLRCPPLAARTHRLGLPRPVV